MHGLASHFVYVATIALVYVRMCIIIFVSAHNTLVFKSKIFYKSTVTIVSNFQGLTIQ